MQTDYSNDYFNGLETEEQIHAFLDESMGQKQEQQTIPDDSAFMERIERIKGNKTPSKPIQENPPPIITTIESKQEELPHLACEHKEVKIGFITDKSYKEYFNTRRNILEATVKDFNSYRNKNSEFISKHDYFTLVEQAFNTKLDLNNQDEVNQILKVYETLCKNYKPNAADKGRENANKQRKFFAMVAKDKRKEEVKKDPRYNKEAKAIMVNYSDEISRNERTYFNKLGIPVITVFRRQKKY